MKKETLAQVFSCEFYEIFKNTFFTEHLRTTASDDIYALLLLLTEAATRGVLCKKVFLEISQNSQENTCARVSFLIKLQP